MSCACENQKLSREKDRIWRLAKKLAKLEGKNVIMYRNENGTYDFATTLPEGNKHIVEYITPF